MTYSNIPIESIEKPVPTSDPGTVVLLIDNPNLSTAFFRSFVDPSTNSPVFLESLGLVVNIYILYNYIHICVHWFLWGVEKKSVEKSDPPNLQPLRKRITNLLNLPFLGKLDFTNLDATLNLPGGFPL